MLGQLRDNVGKLQKQFEKSPHRGFVCPVQSFKLMAYRIRAMCIAERLAGSPKDGEIGSRACRGVASGVECKQAGVFSGNALGNLLVWLQMDGSCYQLPLLQGARRLYGQRLGGRPRHPQVDERWGDNLGVPRAQNAVDLAASDRLVKRRG